MARRKMTSRSKKERKAKKSTSNHSSKVNTKATSPEVIGSNPNKEKASIDQNMAARHEADIQTENWWQSFRTYVDHLLDYERRLAYALRQFLNALISNLFLLVIFTLIGLNAPADSPPIFKIINQHKTLSILIIMGLTFYLLRVLFIKIESDQEDSNKQSQRKSRFLNSRTILNTVSYSASIFLVFVLVLLFLRPQWCPSEICPSPERIFPPQSVHDENLEMDFIKDQSAFYVIPNKPSQYTLNNLPRSIAALHSDGEKSLLLNHIIIGLNSLQQGRFGMIIEEVNLVITQVAPMQHPLYVWQFSPLINYENDNQYRALYLGQQAGAILPTNFLRYPFGFEQLKPGDTDQIDVHVVSRIEANIWFTVQVVYRIANESQPHTINLSHQFEVMFANNADWNLYHLQGEHFQPDN